MVITGNTKKYVDATLKKVMIYIEENQMFEKGDGVLVGLSGGADSVCLFLILLMLRETYDIKLMAVHLNHMIREGDADKDQVFVERLAAENGVKCISISRDISQLAKENGISEEEAGRVARYQVFANALVDYDFQKVAVAHNANDQAETVLFHLARGTGLKGMTGIPPVRDGIVRPLLCLSREEIERCLELLGQEYCTDITNEEDKYTRNRIRHYILPELETKVNAATVAHIGAVSNDLREIQAYLDKMTEIHYTELVERKEHRLQIRIDKLLELDIVLQRRILRRMLEEIVGKLKDIQICHIQMLLALCNMETGKQISLPYKLTAEREYDYLVINGEDYNLSLRGNSSVVMLTGMKGRLVFQKQGFALNYEVCEGSMPDGENLENPYAKWFDYDKIKNTVFIRKPLSSDFLQISTDGHSKRLRRYFIDEKIPRKDRDSLLVMADGSHVMWVIGKGRTSEKYRVGADTRPILKCTYETIEE